MSENEKRHDMLANFNEQTKLRTDLNVAIASLAVAEKSQFRPHLCLNGKEGLEVLKQISASPEDANTAVAIGSALDYDGGKGIWLNICFSVFIDRFCIPTNNVRLSPRQTAYVVKNLPPESQAIVLEKVKAFYFEEFLKNVKDGLDKITEQFNSGSLLTECDHRNRIFDIQVEREMDMPQTEIRIVGEELFFPLFCGITLFDRGQDGFESIDKLLSDIDNRRSSAAKGMLNLMRSL